jgi:hypothetical protein
MTCDSRWTLLVLALVVGVTLGSTPVSADEFTASFEVDGVVVDGKADSPPSVTLRVTGRSGPMMVRSPNVSDAMLAEMFDGRQSEDGVVVDVPEDGNMSVTFPRILSCSPGRYDFTLVDGNASATASIDVDSLSDAVASVERRPTATAGATVTVPFTVDLCFENATTMTIGNRTTPLRANVTVTPKETIAHREGTVTLDTGNVTGPEAFEVTGDFVLQNISVTRTPTDGRLPPGEYPIRMVPADGTLITAGSLIIVAGPSTSTATPTPTASPTPSDTPVQTNADSQTTDTSGPGFGVFVGILSLIVVLVVIYTRQR